MSSHRRVSRSEDGVVDAVLGLVVDWTSRKPAPQLPRRLDALFRELAKPLPSRHPDEIEDLIWALWIAHPEPEAEHRMGLALEAIAAGEHEIARPLLDRLVQEHPDWAEAWNKRATLAFMEHRDEESLADIGRTLSLEPRHFGALNGFGQICLRNGRLAEARAAFQVALAVNPHMHGVREFLDEIRPELMRLH
jgi:tetratricopeptide (TPR) repeat protein